MSNAHLFASNREYSSGAAKVVNDRHSRLNATRVARIERPENVSDLERLLRRPGSDAEALCIAGGMHAMGGQQFAEDAVMVDTCHMNRVISFDRDRGHVEVEAGIHWPELIAWLERAQRGRWPQWGIRQKQTGADRLSIGGTLSANAHGRGLTMRPFIDDVESFSLLDADGRIRACSRDHNRELFGLVIGGYGLFGVVLTVKLRLMRRVKMERLVSVIDIEDVVASVTQRISNGCLYGDFQFAIDAQSENFLRKGVLSCYRPIEDDAVIPANQKELDRDDWMHLLYLAHVDKSRAFEIYAEHYLSTNGQRYWSDRHQLSEYFDDYHRELDDRLGASGCGTEMITELYVPRTRLASFMGAARRDLIESGADVIYGTVRFIEKDRESFLPWAREDYACIIFNLHTAHDRAALEKTADVFRRLIDRAIDQGGSYYLTYHRWATRAQVRHCYPELGRFLALKRQYDPGERFQSEWYRHYKRMLDSST